MGWAGDPLRAADSAGMVERQRVATEVGNQRRRLVKGLSYFLGIRERTHGNVPVCMSFIYQQFRTSVQNVSWQAIIQLLNIWNM